MDIRYISTISSKSIDNLKNVDKFTLIQDNLLQRTGDVNYKVDYCEFPYYRNSRTNGSQDAVLVKDVGISCNLLKENVVESDTSCTKIESYLVRQLKLEYNELSNITRKINSYTKDILNNLALRCKREDCALQNLNIATKYVTESQYTDDMGKPYLKLRFRNDTEKNCRSSEIDLNHNLSEKEIFKEEIHEKHANAKKRCSESDKASLKKILGLSPKYNGTLISNYLKLKREKIPNSTLKASLYKAANLRLDKVCKNSEAYKARKFFYTNKCDPVILTNWKELSRRKNCGYKNASIANNSGESQYAVSNSFEMKNQSSHCFVLKERHKCHNRNDSNLFNTDFRVFNVRIAQKK